MPSKILLVVSIDTECDKGDGWRVKQPLEFKNISIGIKQRLQPMLERHECVPSYLLSPEIIDDPESCDYFRSISSHIDLGTHLHSEFVGPESRHDCEYTSSFLGDYSAEVQYQKLEILTDRFTEAFGKQPTAFRAGRYGLSQHTLSYLQKLGYRVDSSVTPDMWWWRNKSSGVNYLGTPLQPYFPDTSDVRRTGASPIMEVPISIYSPFWVHVPRQLKLLINPINRYQTIALNLCFKRWFNYAWLRPTFSDTDQMLKVSQNIIASHTGDSTVLCMMFHSNETLENTSPYNKTTEDAEQFIGRIDDYLTRLKSSYDVHSVGLSELPDLLN